MKKVLKKHKVTVKKPLKKRTVTSPQAKKKRKLKIRHVTYPKAPGRADREGISLIQLFELFPDEDSARRWFEDILWEDGERKCPRPRCRGSNTYETKTGKPQPYRCTDCRKYFSVKTNTVMQDSNIPLREWAMSLYIMCTNLKGVASMKLHRDLGITQSNAWHMVHRIREAWDEMGDRFDGPVEVDEAHIGGKEKNKHAKKKLHDKWPTGKSIVSGMKDRRTNKVRGKVIEHATAATLQEFIKDNVEPGTTVYTDEHRGYQGLDNHETVNHSVGEYVRDQAHTNGIESFWALLKRGYTGTFHKMSKKHLHRYVNEFAGRHNIRSLDTIDQMRFLALGMVGKQLRYKDLIR